MSYEYKYARPLMAGAIFGAALTSAGVYYPAVIIGQMNFQDFTMLKVFLTATAVSASVIPRAIKAGFTNVQPRQCSTVGWVGRYDANILGGALLGIGMSLTGACPGTVLPQIATGVSSSMFVGIGGIAGAMLFEKYGEGQLVQGERPTVHSTLQIEETWPKAMYQFICMSIVAGAAYLFPGNRHYLVSPYIGGILIAFSQGASLALTGNALGVSGAYASVAHWITSTYHGSPKDGRDYRSVVFVTGALLGSFLLSQLAAPLPSAPPVELGLVKAVVGGALLIIGARLGGGCTSGHGITGMSQLSLSSFVTVAAMFGGGMGWSFLFSRHLGWVR